MARYFTVPQAERVLPKVKQHLEDALFQKSEYQSAHDEMESVLDRIRSSGGAQVDPGSMRRMKTQREESVAKLQAAMEAINELGAQVKDLDIGLIDFLSLYQDREVCLCWKLGEGGIDFWHGTDEGFRGRKKIDAEFLAAHRGDGVQ
jgi:hypothetical protein